MSKDMVHGGFFQFPRLLDDGFLNLNRLFEFYRERRRFFAVRGAMGYDR